MAETADSLEERREHPRVRVRLAGRYMLENGAEFPGETVDVSRVGVVIRGANTGRIGERVIAYIDDLGRIEGVIVRSFADQFALTGQQLLEDRALGLGVALEFVEFDEARAQGVAVLLGVLQLALLRFFLLFGPKQFGVKSVLHAAEFGAVVQYRKHLAGIEQPLFVEGAFDAHLRVEIDFGEHRRHEVELLDADAMLSGDRAADFNAHAQYVGAKVFSPLKFAGLIGIK